MHIGLDHDGVEGLIDPTATLQDRGEEAALADLRDLEGEIPGLRGDLPGSGSIPPGRPRQAPLMRLGADVVGGLLIDQGLVEEGSRNLLSAPSSPSESKKGRRARKQRVTAENIFDVALQRPSGLRPAQGGDSSAAQLREHRDGNVVAAAAAAAASGGGAEPGGMFRQDSEGNRAQAASSVAPHSHYSNAPSRLHALAGEVLTTTGKGSSASRVIARAMSADPVNLDKVRPLDGCPGASTSDTGRVKFKSPSVSSVSETRRSETGAMPDLRSVEQIVRAYRMEGLPGAGGGGKGGDGDLGRTTSASQSKEMGDGKDGNAMVGRRLQTRKKAENERPKVNQTVDSLGAVSVVRTRKKAPAKKIGDVAVKSDTRVPKDSQSNRSRSVPKKRPLVKRQAKTGSGEDSGSGKANRGGQDDGARCGVSMDKSWEVPAGDEGAPEDGSVKY